MVTARSYAHWLAALLHVLAAATEIEDFSEAIANADDACSSDASANQLDHCAFSALQVGTKRIHHTAERDSACPDAVPKVGETCQVNSSVLCSYGELTCPGEGESGDHYSVIYPIVKARCWTSWTVEQRAQTDSKCVVTRKLE
eukprot:TRINITY_DN92798_c0_g1_i1.p1 TRINITY_DN92798_c0_g1~~TRINITY_DN92798_c0_g1_i1.p1  ORF type:complete len:143 (-),score=14.67 TRINITY_DN92798_c0_g1_i1:162-590(-)